MRLLLPFLICLSAVGQNAFFGGAASFQNADFTTNSHLPVPQRIPGLERWWVASDLGGVSSVSDWTDRIQGKVLRKDVAGGAISNSQTNYVTFATNTRMTNTAQDYVLPSNSGSLARSFVILLKMTPGHTTGNQCIYTATTDAADGLSYLATVHAVEWFANSILNNFAATNGVLQDWFLTMTNPAAGSVSFRVFTNGVWCSDTAVNAPRTLYSIGGNGAGNNPLFGDVYEILSYTNAGTPLTSNNVAQLHTYFTNTYGYAP